jgi:MFS transporter, NNP family, nitrate/nitrite transporter
MATLTFIFGQDHPAGRWEDRQKSLTTGNHNGGLQKKDKESENAHANLNAYQGQEADINFVNPTMDMVAVKKFNLVAYLSILASPLTWLPPLAYLTTLGLELAIDGNFGNILFALFNQKRSGFGQTQAEYYTSIL